MRGVSLEIPFRENAGKPLSSIRVRSTPKSGSRRLWVNHHVRYGSAGKDRALHTS
jgi:hypothetical protein